MKKLTLLLLALFAFSACEKEPDTEWNRLEQVIRAHGNFDAEIVLSLLAQGIAVRVGYCVKEVDVSQYCRSGPLYVGWAFALNGKVGMYRAEVQPGPGYVVERGWEYDAATRTISYGETELVVKAVVPETELIVQEAESGQHADGTPFVWHSRSVWRLITEAEFDSRYGERFEDAELIVI